jgi:hypothetical protein
MAVRTGHVGSVAPMRSAQLRPAVVLAAFTLLVWTTRIRNIWTDDELTTAGQLGRTALALVFTAFAAATILLWLRARRDRSVDGAPTLVRAFAAWTVAVWVVRGTQIALADHDTAFVVVHTLLAVVSIGLALWADRSARRVPDREQVLQA